MRTATFALFAGIVYLSAGVLGLVPEALMAAAAGRAGADAPHGAVRLPAGPVPGQRAAQRRAHR